MNRTKIDTGRYLDMHALKGRQVYKTSIQMLKRFIPLFVVNLLTNRNVLGKERN